MKNIISQKQLDTANLAVTRELHTLGFRDEALSETNAYLTRVGAAYGWQGYEGTGDIYIPAVSLGTLRNRILRDFRRYAPPVSFIHYPIFPPPFPIDFAGQANSILLS